jgi:hypothetical protein
VDKLLIILGGIVFLVFVSFLLSWPVYMLWNECLVDAVTVTKPVTWLQAWGISLLCGILFKTTITSKE